MPIHVSYQPKSKNERRAFMKIVNQVFSNYSMSLAKTKPVFEGGFSVLFNINGHPDRLLRIEYQDKTKQRTEQLIQNTILVEERIRDLVPQTFGIKIFPFADVVPNTKGCVLISEIERLDIVDWLDWKKYFDSAQQLAAKYLDLVNTLVQNNIYHSDVSENNIICLRDGKMKIIDYLDSCVMAHQHTCNVEPFSHTADYEDTTLSEGKPNSKMLFIQKLVFGKVDNAIYKIRKPKWSPAIHLQSMLYACGVLLITILARNAYTLQDISQRTYNAFPSNVKRSIESLVTLGERKVVLLSDPPAPKRKSRRRKTGCNSNNTQYKLSNGSWKTICKGVKGGMFIVADNGKKQYIKCD